MLLSLLKMLKRGEWALIGCLFALSFIPVFGGLLRVIEISIGLTIVPENPRVTAAPVPVVLHVIGSFIFCIFGVFQFLSTIRRHVPRFHKANGLVVAIAGFVSATTGLWMTHFYNFPSELQGDLLYWVRVTVSLTMAGFIVLGFVSIRTRRIKLHYSSMISAYALGQGASTQTVLGLAWMTLLGNEPSGLPRDLMMTAAWIINAAFALWIITRDRIPATYTPVRV